MQQLEPIAAALKSVEGLWEGMQPLGESVLKHLRLAGTDIAYETLWLDLVFDIGDARGERVVLTRRQRVRSLTHVPATVRELVWGDGEHLAHYSVRGARRVGE